MFDQKALIAQTGKLKKFAMRLTRNPSDADDLTQSTILRALEKQHLFTTGTNLFGWMSRIMYNIFVSEYRRKAKFETRYDPDIFIESQTVAAVQDDMLELRRVNDAMNGLSGERREVMVMICVNGMKYDAVSKALKIPVGTVRSRLSRARGDLQLLLAAGSRARRAAAALAA